MEKLFDKFQKNPYLPRMHFLLNFFLLICLWHLSELKNRTNKNFFLKKSFPSDIYYFKIFPKKFPEQNFIQINLISNQIKKSPRKNFLFRFYIIPIAYFFHLNRTLFLSSYSAFDQSSFMYFAMDYLIFKDLLAYFEFQQFWGIFHRKVNWDWKFKIKIDWNFCFTRVRSIKIPEISAPKKKFIQMNSTI